MCFVLCFIPAVWIAQRVFFKTMKGPHHANNAKQVMHARKSREQHISVPEAGYQKLLRVLLAQHAVQARLAWLMGQLFAQFALPEKFLVLTILHRVMNVKLVDLVKLTLVCFVNLVHKVGPSTKLLLLRVIIAQ